MRQQRNVTKMKRESERQPQVEVKTESKMHRSNPSVVCQKWERKRERASFEEGKEEEEVVEVRRDTVQRKQRGEHDHMIKHG